VSVEAERGDLIEQVMIFALGFLVAGILALASLPAFWQRALRLSRRRLEMQMPLSMREIYAERDQLRAEFAVGQRRLEQVNESLGVRHARDMLALGTKTVEITNLESKIAGLTSDRDEKAGIIETLQSNLAKTTDELATTAKSLADMSGLHDRKRDALADLTNAHETLQGLAEERRIVIECLELKLSDLQRSLEENQGVLATSERALGFEKQEVAALGVQLSEARTDIQNLEALAAQLGRRVGELETELERTASDLRGKVHEAMLLTDRLEQAREDTLSLEQKQNWLTGRLEAETSRAALAQKEFNDLRARFDSEMTQMRVQSVKLDAHKHALEDIKQRGKEAQEYRDLQVDAARRAERTFAGKVDELRAENVALLGALDVARRECTNLRRELTAQRLAASPPGVRSRSEDAENIELRRKISEVAAAVMDLAKKRDDKHEDEPDLPERVRPVAQVIGRIGPE
jgi:chromosome segregation ATPase